MNNGGRPCARHPYMPVIGVCACCLRDRLTLLAAATAADDDYAPPTGVRGDDDRRGDQKEMLRTEAMMTHLAPPSPLQSVGGRHSNACHLERYRVVNRLLVPPARHSDASAYGQKALQQLRQKLEDKHKVKEEESTTAPSNAKKKRIPFWSFPTPKKTQSSSSSSSSSSTSWISSLLPVRWRRHSHRTKEAGEASIIAGRPSTVDGSPVASFNQINHRKPLHVCINKDKEEHCQSTSDELKHTTTIPTILSKKDSSSSKYRLSFMNKPFSRNHSEGHNGTSIHPSSPFHHHGAVPPRLSLPRR